MLREGDGVVQHVLELGQHVRDLPHDHRQGGDTGVRPGCYVSALNWDMTYEHPSNIQIYHSLRVDFIFAASEYVDVN